MMKASEFKDWIKSIERMSRSQRDKLRERLAGRAGVDTIIELIEQGQNAERICPYNAIDAATAITHLML